MWGGVGTNTKFPHLQQCPEGDSNPQPVLRHVGVVSTQKWATGERLCGGDANVLSEELEPLRFTALLLRAPEAFGCYISLHSARSACRLTDLSRSQSRQARSGRPST